MFTISSMQTIEKTAYNSVLFFSVNKSRGNNRRPRNFSTAAAERKSAERNRRGRNHAKSEK